MGESESEYGSEYGAEYGAGYGGMMGGGRSQFGRYVDATGNPLPPSATQPFAEFKMMPVRMRLTVDQRKLDKLLVNCANSDMPIKIVRVLIRPGQGTQTGGMMDGMSPMSTMGSEYGSEGGTYGMGEGYTPESSGAEYGPAAYGSGGSSPAGPGMTQGQTGSNDVPVLIEGVIYIFNPPDFSMLGKEGGRELVSGQSLAPPETAAAETPGEQPTGEAADAVQPPAAQPTSTAPGTAAPGPAVPPTAPPAEAPATAPPPEPATAAPGTSPAAPAPATGAPAVPPTGTAPGAPPSNQP